eukprot:SAG11_NODE_3500_length_2408_cov_1.650931_2_plen_74_part_00
MPRCSSQIVLSLAPDNNVHDVLTEGAERLIQPWQSRKQVIVMEECHRQNPLPRRPQVLNVKRLLLACLLTTAA